MGKIKKVNISGGTASPDALAFYGTGSQTIICALNDSLRHMY